MLGKSRFLCLWFSCLAVASLSLSGCGSDAPPMSVGGSEGPTEANAGSNSAQSNGTGPSVAANPAAGTYGPAVNPQYGSNSQNTAQSPSRYSADAKAANAQDQAPQYGTVAEKRIMVKITTSLGVVSISLFPDKAPITVDNFLRNYVDTKFYQNTIVHYADSGIVAAGGFTDRFAEKPTSNPIRNEANNGLRNVRGTVAMGRAFDKVDSATSQFFFNVADNPDFDHQGASADQYGYCVFAQVVEGMDILDQIAAAQTHDANGLTSVPVRTVLIKDVELLANDRR